MRRRIVGARDRERAIGLAERLAQRGNRLGRHAGARAGRGGIEIRDRLGERREVEARVRRYLAILDQHVEHAPRDVGLRAGRRRDPVVALRRRHAEPRSDVGRAADSQRAAPILRRAKQRILARELHRRLPRLEEVRAERNQHLGLIDSIGRQIAPAKQRLRRDARRLLVDCFVKYRARRILRSDKRQRDFLEGRTLRRPEERDAILARLRRRRQPVVEQFPGFVPRHCPQRAVAAANLRMRQSVRIVQSLQRSLPARAQSALSDRIGGIALELDDAPFTDSRDHAASGRALCAGRRKEARYSRHYVFIGHDVRNQLARRRLAAGQRGSRARSRGQLDE